LQKAFCISSVNAAINKSIQIVLLNVINKQMAGRLLTFL